MAKLYYLRLPKKNDYPKALKILKKAGTSAEYQQLVEASASAYFETKGPARWLFMKRFQIALNYLKEIGVVDDLLDAATGIGYFLPSLSQTAERIWALDYTPYSLKYAKSMCRKKGIKNVRFRQGDLLKLPFKKEQFDVIVALSVLEHIPPQKLTVVMKHFHRVLKPNGYLIAGYPNEGSLLFKLVKQTEKRLMRPKVLKSIEDENRDHKLLGHVAKSRQIDKAIKEQFKIFDCRALPFGCLKFYSVVWCQNKS